jgi:peptidoglycan hydrolase-like protein with peptidoglycan-binding domain
MLAHVATFSPLKPPSEPRKFQSQLVGAPINGGGTKRRRRWLLPVGIVGVVLIVLAAFAVVLMTAKASLQPTDDALAKIGMPLGGGKIVSVSVIGGREQKLVPVTVKGDPEIVAKEPVPADEQLKIRVVIKRPGWVSWLSGKTETLTLKYTTPTASTRTHFITLGKGAPLKLHFKAPIEAYEYGTTAHNLKRTVLHKPSSVVTVPHSGQAGTLYVAAQIHKWESSSSAQISYFPGGHTATAVSYPSPGKTINPTTPITLSFSKPVAKVLGSHRPTITPATSGSWKQISSHRLEFVPSGYGYGLDAHVQIALPNGVRLVGGQSGTATSGSWTVPNGSVTRAEQILADLGYLPVNFKYAGKGVGTSLADQENAAVNTPKGSFSWRFPNTPDQLKEQWQPGADGVVLKGAIMMFESDHDMTADGILGPSVWKALLNANVHNQKSTFGYSFVMVHEASSGETSTLWHNGETIITTPANTGVAGAETALGTYPVFEHLASTTMSGTNADGSTYVDPGILWVSYFNGGDALHYYARGSYGFPQSNGCVEMPEAAAAKIWPYTPIGALVDVST